MMERVDQERPGWDGDQFEVLTGEEVVGVGGDVAEGVGPGGVGPGKVGLLGDGAGAGAGGEEVDYEGNGGGEVGDGEEDVGGEVRWEGNNEETGDGEADGDRGEDEVEDEGVALLRRLVRDFSVKTLAEKTGVAEGVLVECHLGVRNLNYSQSGMYIYRMNGIGQGGW